MSSSFISYCIIGVLAGPLPAGAETGGDVDVVEALVPVDGQVWLQLTDEGLRAIQPTVAGGGTSADDRVVCPISAGGSLTILVTNGDLRGVAGGELPIGPDNALVLATASPDSGYDLVIRSGSDGHDLFGVTVPGLQFDAGSQSISILDASVRLTRQGAVAIGAPELAGADAGRLSLSAAVVITERRWFENGELRAAEVLPHGDGSGDGGIGGVIGPDVIVGIILGVSYWGSQDGSAAISVGTTSCNRGDRSLNWFAMPNTDHPVIPQNLYRLRSDRFEQIGQSWLKHAFTSLNLNECGFGCQNPGSGSFLGPGCSDPYSASLNGSQTGLGSRAWVNPFTGAYPNTARDHGGHSHNTLAHRVAIKEDEIDPLVNVNSQFFVEAQYVTPHEYTSSAQTGNLNMFNNASYRRCLITGTSGNWTFAMSGNTVQEQPAIHAWTGATRVNFDPNPGTDGRAILAWKVTQISAGLWHYEYVLYNMNFDRAFASFNVPVVNCGTTVFNVDFHAPPQEPAWANDGTFNNLGYSDTPWIPQVLPGSVRWTTETYAQNRNANAVRWGTLYNFRFDATRPPTAGNIEIGIFKPGTPTSVLIAAQVPAGAFVDCNSNGVADACDIANGTSTDCNANGVPDDCTGDGPARIVSHPQDQAVGLGDAATFHVTADGAAPLAYQWRKNGSNIPGATGTSYTIDPVTLSDVGTYDVRVTNVCGSADSNDASLTICVGCDANCDGSINTFDIQPLVDMLEKAPPSPCSPCAGDTNADGSVNPFDIQGLLDCLGG